MANETISSLYHRYCYAEKVSVDSGAISEVAAQQIYQLLEERRPRRVLDTGSGFTSALLRAYAAAQPPGEVEVVSVDHDAGWLGRTEAFLQRHRLSVRNLVHDLANVPEGPYDLIIHDYGHMDLRAHTLPHVWGMLAPGGMLVLDDLHFSHYYQVVRDFFQDHEVQELRETTTDKYGRFIGVVVKHAFPEAEAADEPGVTPEPSPEEVVPEAADEGTPTSPPEDAGPAAEEPPTYTGALDVVVPAPAVEG